MIFHYFTVLWHSRVKSIAIKLSNSKYYNVILSIEAEFNFLKYEKYKAMTDDKKIKDFD